MKGRCAHCGRRLALGVNVIATQHAVVGQRGVVPLEEPAMLCDDDCARLYYTRDLPKVGPRIP